MKNTILTLILCMLSLLASAKEKIPAQSNSTVSLILYDARTNQPVAGFNPIKEGDIINLYEVGVKLSILAKVDGQVGSVKFSYNGTENYKIESGAPYTIKGDKDGNIYWWTPDQGNNTVTATVYSKAKAQGDILGSTTVNFQVVNQETVVDEEETEEVVEEETEEVVEEETEESPTPEASDKTISLILYDASTNQPVADFNPIKEGNIINLNEVGVKLSIMAKVDGQVGSVKFSYNGNENYKIESAAPYTIKGDKDGNIYWWTPDLGNNTVTATAYSQAKAQGDILGSTTVNFQVVNQETVVDEEETEEVEEETEEVEEEIISDIVIKNTVTVSKSVQIDKRWLVESHTHIKGTPGAVIKVDPGSIKGGFVLLGVKDVIFEGLTIDVSASRNFVSGIWLENTSNVIIKNCKFINSKKSTADPAWTIHGINARNIKNVKVLNNISDGCQFKLDGGTYSAEDVIINDNDIRDCTQMGISVVAIPHSEKVVIKNITIKRNKIDKTDNHGIYVGVDNGKGEYSYPTTLENIVIADNTIGELSHLKAGQRPKGILINGTKDAKNIQVINNTITNPKLNDYIIGIQMKCLDGGKTSGLSIKGNQITDFGNYNIFIEGAQDIAVSGNYFKKGKGIIVKSSANGSLYNNYFTDTSGKIKIVNSSNITAD